MSLLFLALLPAAGVGQWRLRTLREYVRLRSSGEVRGSALWEGVGTLRNTITGQELASVECVELTRALPLIDGEDAALRTSRMLVYRDACGFMLHRCGRRRVWPLAYTHDVRMCLDGGEIKLSAESGGAGQPVVGIGVADTTRPALFVRALRLQVRVLPPFTRRKQPLSPTAGTREEYSLIASVVPGVQPQLMYSRTGRCPTWCSAGVCTLEIRSKRTRGWPWRRTASESQWSARIAALEKENERAHARP